jgi:hypothetical protein
VVGAAAFTSVAAANAANLLTNPGFEAGNLSGWSCNAGLGSVVSSPVHSGTKALAGAASDSDQAQCTQTVAVQANTPYTLSAWVRGSFIFLGVTGGTSTWTQSPSGYIQLKASFTTAAGQTSVQIYLHGWYGQGTYNADDVSLDGPGGPTPSPTPTPTPTPTPSPGVPGVPGTPTVSGSTNTSIALSWGAAGGTVSGYRVYEGATLRSTVTSTTANLTGLGSCTSHTYTVAAYNGNGESAHSGAVTGTTTGCPTGTAMAAPYYYTGWDTQYNLQTVMSTTGIRQFTMAFILSGGGCSPAWDGNRPLTGGADQAAINSIRAAGGDVEVSFGGWSGNKLGPNCSTDQALAGAYQQVINAYNLKYIDIDIENTDEFENDAVQDRILSALKIVKQNNPGIKTILTFGTGINGLTAPGTRLVNRAAALRTNGVDFIDNFTIMPFDFGCPAGQITSCTTSAAGGLKTALKSAFAWTDAQAYAHMGISGMNDVSDQNENTTTGDWTAIRNWANTNHITRLAFWSVNRDRNNWVFTQITAGFTG